MFCATKREPSWVREFWSPQQLLADQCISQHLHASKRASNQGSYVYSGGATYIPQITTFGGLNIHIVNMYIYVKLFQSRSLDFS
jgi:hypothetical protein